MSAARSEMITKVADTAGFDVASMAFLESDMGSEASGRLLAEFNRLKLEIEDEHAIYLGIGAA